MIKGLEAIKELDEKYGCFATSKEYDLLEVIIQELKALEIIKNHITEEFGINNDKYQRHAFLLRFMEGEEKDYEFIKEVLGNE